MSKAYRDSGVDLHAGYESVERIKKHIAKTNRLGVMGMIGAFGGMFDLSALNMKAPVLVSGTDGVGTKLMVAFAMDKHDTIGQDVVAMCVNDILAQGAQPLYFLDYIAVGKNRPDVVEKIVKGIADGCVLAGAALVGGETAEMPDMYEETHYDIAGFCVGAVEKADMITGDKVATGDTIIGIASSGVHSNGFSLVRKILFKDNDLKVDDYIEQFSDTLGNVILTPTKIYIKSVLAMIKAVDVHGIAHITGGGFDENIPRALKDGQGAKIIESSLPKLPIFDYLEKLGGIDHREMYNIFNMGVGMAVMVKDCDAQKAMDVLKLHGEDARVIGKVVSGQGVKIIS
jgi:phosphoribosylformylglycinamidine cyclo-ligase